MKPALFLYSHISSYSALLVLGFFFGWLLARSRAKFYGILTRDLDNIGLILPIAGLFGARFFARLFYAKLPLVEALKVWEGDGLVFYGGFIFGIGAVVLYGVLKRIKLLRLVDCLAPSVALGLAFGRVGCFLAGCCWGDVCVAPEQLSAIRDPEVIRRIHTVPSLSAVGSMVGVRFPVRSDIYKQHAKLGLVDASETKSLAIHPVQIYESVLAAGLCVFLCVRSRKARYAGQVALGMLVGYAVIRFGTEFLRADNKVYALGLTFSQVVSVWILLLCAAVTGLRVLFGNAKTAIPVEDHVVSTVGSGSSSSI